MNTKEQIINALEGKKGCLKQFSYLYGHEKFLVRCGEYLINPRELVLCEDCKMKY